MYILVIWGQNVGHYDTEVTGVLGSGHEKAARPSCKWQPWSKMKYLGTAVGLKAAPL